MSDEPQNQQDAPTQEQPQAGLPRPAEPVAEAPKEPPTDPQRERSLDPLSGRGAEPCAGYRPTYFELQLLARHWAKEEAFLPLIRDLGGATGLSDAWLMMHAGARLDALAVHLGAPMVNDVIAEADRQNQRGSGLTDQQWVVWKQGSAEERHALGSAYLERRLECSERYDRTLYHEAGRLVLGRRSGHGEPVELLVYLEDESPFGRTVFRWTGADPGRTEALVRSLWAGALAEAKCMAELSQDLPIAFALDQSVEALVDLPADPKRLSLDFIRDDRGQVVLVEAETFREDVEAVQNCILRGQITRERAIAQLRQAQEQLNDPEVWSEVCCAVQWLRQHPLAEAARCGFTRDQVDAVLVARDGLTKGENPM